MLFIEVLRIILVLFGASGGLELGRLINPSPAPVVGMILGSLLFYVIGGVLGRLVARFQDVAVDRLFNVSPGELFAGTLTAVGGLLLGAAICVPFLILFHYPILFPAAAALIWVLAWLGYRIGKLKGRQVIAAAGLSRIFAPPTDPPTGFAILVETSAVLDHALLVLGTSGLLVGGLVVPRFVIDEVQTLAAGPDPSSSRRARRGLESIEVLRESGVSVQIADQELPEIVTAEERLLEMARRLGLRLATSSPALAKKAVRRGIAVADLRQTADAILHEILPGERLHVDLERPGNQARQAVGYLPDGDMVVVNDAAHLIGTAAVPVHVLSTRRTGQGLLVFAQLDDPKDATADEPPVRALP